MIKTATQGLVLLLGKCDRAAQGDDMKRAHNCILPQLAKAEQLKLFCASQGEYKLGKY